MSLCIESLNWSNRVVIVFVACCGSVECKVRSSEQEERISAKYLCRSN